MDTFEDRKKRFHDLYEAIKKSHRDAYYKNSGHGLEHDLMVAQMGVQLTDNIHMQDMVWVSALMHSLDHLFEEKMFEEKIREHMIYINSLFNEEEKKDIFTAVKNHGQLNADTDSELLCLLKDADRLGNALLIIAIRSGQFLPHLPPFEFENIDEINPQATYYNKFSCFDDLRWNLTYEEMLRTPKAREIGAPFFMEIRNYLKKCSEQVDMLGLKNITL